MQQIVCDTDDPDLQTWAMVVNLHMQDNPERGITDLLGRAEGALDAKYKEHKIEKKDENGQSFPNDDGTNEAENVRMQTEPTASIPTKQAKTGQQIAKEIQVWIRENTYVNVNFLAIHEDRFQAELTIGPDYNPFQISFTSEWDPMFLITDTHELQDVAAQVNSFLTEREKDELMTVSEVLDNVALNYNEKQRQGEESMVHIILSIYNLFDSRTMHPREPEREIGGGFMGE